MSDFLTALSDQDGQVTENENSGIDPNIYTVQLAEPLPDSAIITTQAESSEIRGRRAGKVTIMPIGDSITYGVIDSKTKTETGGYRTYLWQALTSGGYRVDFVGSEVNGPKSIDREHAGYRGKTIEQIADLVNGQVTKYKPDVILLLVGTNDILQDKNLEQAPQRLSTLIDQVLETLPGITVLVGTLPPNIQTKDNSAQIQDFNATLAEIINRKHQQGKNVELVDLYNRLTNTELHDHTHPTATGYKEIAKAWFEMLTDVLSGVDDANGAADQSGDPITGTVFTFTGANKNQALQSSILAGNHYDRLLNFNPRKGDRIQLDFDNNLATTGKQERPARLFNAGIQIEQTLKQAIEAAYEDANPHQRGDQRLKPNQAAIFQYRKNFYLSVNNNRSGFQAKGDLFIDLGRMIRADFASSDFHTSSLVVTDYFV